MRARFLLPLLAVVVLTTALAAAGCSDQEAGSSAATTAPATTEPGGQGSGYVTVDVQTASEALSSNEDTQLVDVREPFEWAETGVPQGAVLIPLGELETRATNGLATDAPVYVICRSGNRSRTASEILLGLGFTQVYNVDGGVTAWLDQGLPVETYQP